MIVFMYIRQREPAKIVSKEWKLTIVFLRGLNVVSPEWNTRGKVIIWDIKQFFHKENQTVVEWYFKNEMNTGNVEEFDGISLIEWTEDNKIKSLKEYGCNLNNYNPYQHSDNPQFRDEKISWF